MMIAHSALSTTVNVLIIACKVMNALKCIVSRPPEELTALARLLAKLRKLLQQGMEKRSQRGQEEGKGIRKFDNPTL